MNLNVLIEMDNALRSSEYQGMFLIQNTRIDVVLFSASHLNLGFWLTRAKALNSGIKTNCET